MGSPARRRTYALNRATVAAGASTTFAVPLPSTPFLDEDATPALFRKVTIQAAGAVGTVAANWALTATVQFQPMRSGPSAAFALPAASISGLTVLHDLLAVPGASLRVVCTNNGGAPDTITLAYGGAVSPNWTDVDGG